MNKKKVTRIAATGIAAATLLTGAFAYFTDYTSKELTANAGTMNMKLTEAIDIDGSLNILNPGDKNPFEFKVENTGSKSMDVKQVITVTSSVPLTDKDHEYKMMLGDAELTGGKLQTDGKTIVYTVDGMVLNGSKETETGAKGTSADVAYKFAMDEDAKNAFQGSQVSVKLELFAKQHRNTSAGWSLIDKFETVADA